VGDLIGVFWDTKQYSLVES